MTALNEHIGYDKATKVAKKAMEDGSTVKQAALDLGYLSEPELDEILDPKKLAGTMSFCEVFLNRKR